GNTHIEDQSQLRYAAREGRAIVTCDIVDFTELAGQFIAANLRHAGIVLVAPTFRSDEFSGIADALEQVARAYPGGLADTVVYLRRPTAIVGSGWRSCNKHAPNTDIVIASGHWRRWWGFQKRSDVSFLRVI